MLGYSRISQHFVEQEDSSPCSQHFTGPYPDRISPVHSRVQFNILPSTSRSSYQSLSYWLSRQNPACILPPPIRATYPANFIFLHHYIFYVPNPRHYENERRSGGIGSHILQLDIGYRTVAKFTRKPLRLLVTSPRYQWVGGRCAAQPVRSLWRKGILLHMPVIVPNPSIMQPVI